MDQTLKENGTIDAMENRILGPTILKGLEQRRQAFQDLIQSLPSSKFGVEDTLR